MSLKDFQLNAVILAGLYGNALVIPENGPEGRATQAEKDLQSINNPAENNSPPAARQVDPEQPTTGQAENILQDMGRQTENILQPVAGQIKTKVKKNETENKIGQARFLGDNNSHILILTNDAQHVFLSEGRLSLLIKMLEACKLNTGDTAIVNLAAQRLEYDQLKKQLQPRKILFFGIDPSAIKMPVEGALFNIGDFDDCRYVCAPSLDELDGHSGEAKALKARLWTSLQQLFLQKNDRA